MTKAAVPGHEPPGFTRDASRPVIIIDNFPPFANTDDTAYSIAERARVAADIQPGMITCLLAPAEDRWVS